jgi:hypothetical protein
MAAAWLTHAGWNTIDALVLPGADATSTAGIESILAGVQARTLVLPARPPYGAAVQRALRRPSGSSVRIRPLSGPPPDAAASDAPAMAVTGDLRVVVRGQRADRDIQVRRGCTERPVAVRVTAAATGEVRIEHTGGCGDGRPQVLCLQPSLRYTWVEIR